MRRLYGFTFYTDFFFNYFIISKEITHVQYFLLMTKSIFLCRCK